MNQAVVCSTIGLYIGSTILARRIYPKDIEKSEWLKAIPHYVTFTTFCAQATYDLRNDRFTGTTFASHAFLTLYVSYQLLEIIRCTTQVSFSVGVKSYLVQIKLSNM